MLKTFKLNTFLSFLLLSYLSNQLAVAQFGTSVPDAFDTDDLSIGGDIFNDFNEDLESEQVLEDERFYTYGRFVSLNLGLGVTTFSGNRGEAYDNSPPTVNLGMNVFSSFQLSYVLGVAYSKHGMFFNDPINASPTDAEVGPGQIDISMVRVYTGFRYYIDTTDLNTAITYSNPYFTLRLEYWYVSNKFIDSDEYEDDNGGGIGMGLGGGLEFPVELKESYINVEFLIHAINFHDRLSRAYQAADGGSNGADDLTGLGYSTVANYVVSW